MWVYAGSRCSLWTVLLWLGCSAGRVIGFFNLLKPLDWAYWPPTDPVMLTIPLLPSFDAE